MVCVGEEGRVSSLKCPRWGYRSPAAWIVFLLESSARLGRVRQRWGISVRRGSEREAWFWAAALAAECTIHYLSLPGN